MAQTSIFVALFYLFLDLLQCYNLKLQKPNISSDCESEGICDRVENYPTKLVKELIDKLKSQNTIFNFDEPQPTTYSSRFNDDDEDFSSLSKIKPRLKSQNTIFNFDEPQPTTYSSRFNDDDGDFSSLSKIKRRFKSTKNSLEIYKQSNILNVHRHSSFLNVYKLSTSFKTSYEKPKSLCETTPQFVSPEGAKDRNGVWKFIINDPEEPLQVFRIETCRDQIQIKNQYEDYPTNVSFYFTNTINYRTPMGRCSKNIGFLPDYEGKCIQKTVFREMYYVDEKNNTGRTYFEVPTCCSCTLFRKDNDN